MTNPTDEEQKKYTRRFQFAALVGEETKAVGKIDQLRKVSLEVTAQLGKTTLNVSDVLNLSAKPEEADLEDLDFEERRKYLIELDKAVGEPITLLINGRPFAVGEVISSQEGDSYAIRIVSVISEKKETEADVMSEEVI